MRYQRLSGVWMPFCLAVVLLCVSVIRATAEDWPQFRGPGSGGVSHAQRALPGQPARDHQLPSKTFALPQSQAKNAPWA
ncbi:MAG: hypothetical protein ACKPJJ_23490, partial [Planctomycetaceae bacterium]